MRVLIATQHLDIVGGVETYLRAVLPRLVADGLDIAVLAEHSKTHAGILADLPDVPVWVMGEDDGAISAAMGWRPDVIYSHGLSDPRAESALLDRFPGVLYAHNYLGTCVSGTKCHARKGYEPCSRPLGVGCLAAYFPHGCGGRNPLTMLRSYRRERRRAAGLRRYCSVLVASRHMAEAFRRQAVPADRVKCVPLFPTDMTPDFAPPPPRSRTGRVLFVGRITPLKGLLHLIEALPRAAAELGRSLTLVVAGDGPARGEAEAAARAADVSVEFLGWVDPTRREREMRRAEVLAVPSLWPEPFGLVGIEAGCVGLPAVGYAAGGIPDWLVPGETGESPPPGRPDPVALAAALVRALQDDGYRHRLGVWAWEMARRLTREAHVTELIALLERATAAGPIPLEEVA